MQIRNAIVVALRIFVPVLVHDLGLARFAPARRLLARVSRLECSLRRHRAPARIPAAARA